MAAKVREFFLIRICFPSAPHFSIIKKLKITNDIKKKKKRRKNVPDRSIKQGFHANFIITMKNIQKNGDLTNKMNGNHAKGWLLLKIQSKILFFNSTKQKRAISWLYPKFLVYIAFPVMTSFLFVFPLQSSVFNNTEF